MHISEPNTAAVVLTKSLLYWIGTINSVGSGVQYTYFTTRENLLKNHTIIIQINSKQFQTTYMLYIVYMQWFLFDI